MGKKHKKRGQAQAQGAVAAEEPAEEGLSARGKKVIAAGVLVLGAGFFVLTRTDPEGRNWASHLSPFLILGAYAVIAAGILLPDPGETPGAAEGRAAPAPADTSSQPPQEPPPAA